MERRMPTYGLAIPLKSLLCLKYLTLRKPQLLLLLNKLTDAVEENACKQPANIITSTYTPNLSMHFCCRVKNRYSKHCFILLLLLLSLLWWQTACLSECNQTPPSAIIRLICVVVKPNESSQQKLGRCMNRITHYNGNANKQHFALPVACE